MSKLTLLEFRVTNFRNIDDSGWIPMERITAFVGRNESGKTALLKALHKFNPASKEPFNPQRDFPRDRFTRDYREGADWPACAVKFRVDPSLCHEQLTFQDEQTSATVVVTRFYDGRLTFDFDPVPKESQIARDAIDKAFQEFRSEAMVLTPPAPEHEPTYQTIRTDLLNWCDSCEERLQAFTNLKDNEAITLLEAIRNELNSKARKETSSAVTPLQQIIKQVLQDAKIPSIQEQLENEIVKHLPVFIYFDNYGILDSAVFLPRFVEDLAKEPNDPRIRTINAMFKHVALDVNVLYELGHSQSETLKRAGQQPSPEQVAKDQERKELRSIKLNSASNDITARFCNWWKQRRHKIRYEADGDFFRIWISDDRRPNVDIELEGRSKGFQWFFSFYLVFLVESEDGHKDSILLLDEPALHLHPTAQQELIAFFEELSERNQLIYSTHAPWLIDGQHLERVRPVTEDETGHSRISVGEWPRDRETIFPLQAAAGYAMVRALFQNRKNVLVEGISDYLYLHTLSLLCRQTGKAALSDDIYITPCGGTKLVGHLASLFLGQSVRPLVLLDGDEAGHVRRDALLKELYYGHEKAVLMLDELFEIPGFETEDIIGEKALLPVVNEIIPKRLTLNKDDRANGTLTDYIKASAKRHSVVLPDGWKSEAARKIASQWAISQVSEIPEEILDRAAKLFEQITRRFTMFDVDTAP
ncbi:MAG: AAA family ATPase [Pirellula sp.]